MSLGADGDGVRYLPKGLFQRSNDVVAEFEVIGNQLHLRTAMEWLENNYGNAKYDFWSAGAIGFLTRMKLLWRLIGKWYRLHFSSEKVTCVELMIRLLKRAGYKAVEGLDTEVTKAHELMLALYEHPKEFNLTFATPEARRYLEERCPTQEK
jgi:hypothetical protein